MGASTGKPTGQLYPRHPFLLPIRDLLQQLGTNKETGLSRLEAEQSQRQYGPNKLEGEGAVQWYSILAKQVSNAMILVCVLSSSPYPPPICNDSGTSEPQGNDEFSRYWFLQWHSHMESLITLKAVSSLQS